MTEIENDIRVLKLLTGEEVVAHVLMERERTLELEFPMKVITKYVAEQAEADGAMDVDSINMLVPWINSSAESVVDIERSAIVGQASASDFCVNEWLFQVSQFLDEPKTDYPASTLIDQERSNILTFPKRD